jgi:DNA-binding transcriptional ArsR family regulator
LPTKTAKKPNRKTADAGIDVALVKAISHPDRLLALHELNKRVASPTDLAQALGVEVNYIAYHVRVLEKYGCIELVDTKPRRGATEHFYRATKRAHFRDEEWLKVPASLREPWIITALEVMGQDISDSLAHGEFEAHPDRHCSHTAGIVDEQGWGEVQDLLTETLERYFDIQAGSNERLVEGDGEAIPMAVSMVGFATAPSKD